jgi:mycothione reductase
MPVEAVLVAIGRVPNTDTLAAASVGFDLHKDGRLVVDPQQRVYGGGRPVPGVFALGDVNSAWQLKHVANHEARIVQHNISHPDALIGGDPGPVPSAIFSDPEVAHFGLTEAQARQRAERGDGDYVTATQDYGGTAYGWGWEDTTSFCKLVVAADSAQLLGAHIIGPEASILIQPLILAASLEIGVRGLARSQYWPHPAATEVVENALLKAEEALQARDRELQ